MKQLFTVGFCTFSYGGNGGISSEVPDIREWMVPTVSAAAKDPRIEAVRIWNLSDTPITMTRNRAVIMAREFGVDVLVMIDSDMKPDAHAGEAMAKPFFASSFDFLVNHYAKGPCVIGAPYCGPPPRECVYVFRWQSHQSQHPNPDFQLEMYDRHTAATLGGIQDVAALPTGLIMYDMRAFAITEPKTEADKPWFYYEFKDRYASEKISTEDVTQTRDLSLAGIKTLGYNPLFCNWDAWAGHWKPKCVGKPQFIDASSVSRKLTESAELGVESSTRLHCLSASPLMASLLKTDRLPPPVVPFNPMGMQLPKEDADALTAMVRSFTEKYGVAPSVLEVGSWAGKSACIMADAGATVHCVDTWEGNIHDDGTRQYKGAEEPMDVFVRNVLGRKITHTRASSPDASWLFKDDEFDIVYIDAEHTYVDVLADIEAWTPKARYIVAGHDYYLFEGVRLAVKDSGLPNVVVSGNVWSSERGA